MPEASGLWVFTDPVSSEEIEEAKQSLDRALLAQVGLPEDIDIREMENGLLDLVESVRDIFDEGFKPSRLISSLPILIMKGEALWSAVEAQIGDELQRKDFIGRVITYAYRKVDPNLPVVSGLAEVMIENLILGAIPDLVDNLDNLADSLVEKLKGLFG